jgi:prepilin-type N-terminal cleavage/methylation domain-containing protein
MAPQSLSHSNRRGFTLIELLVVISIIALLMAILMPALGRARDSALNRKCLMNLKQIMIGWGVYMNDYDNFPVGRDAEGDPEPPLYSWGGVHWYGSDSAGNPTEPFWLARADRPVNPYIGSEERQQHRAEIFRCPRDTGVRYAETGEMVGWTDFSDDNRSEEGHLSVFGMLGNSYQANDWMYCRIGAVYGQGRPDPVNLKFDMGPANVMVTPSRFVVVGDTGSNYAGRYDPGTQLRMNIITGWWHQEHAGQMGFLDGSARIERMGDVVTKDYSFYLDPGRHMVDNAWHRINAP